MKPSEYKPRLTIPEKGNKYYNTKSVGGYSPCILGNYPFNSPKSKRTGYPGRNVLSNCVGYATGRFNEIIGNNNCAYLGSDDAKNFMKFAEKQKLKVGTIPKVGACIVWSNSAKGHVAIVEEVIDANTIKVSESGWNSQKPFWTAIHRKGNNNWIDGEDYSWMKTKGYECLGFIYNPAIEDNTITVLYNGEEVECTGININQTNYIKLRDLENVFHLAKVTYNSEKKLPSVDTE